jgi:hypothetical protein
MAIVVEDGTGKTDSVSYIDVTDADTYFSTRLYSTTWTGADTASKESALVTATRQIDTYWNFYGERASTTQALQWPRSSVTDRDGNVLASNAIPVALKSAVCEMAIAMLAKDRAAEDKSDGLTRLKADSLEMEWSDKIKPARTLFPSLVSALLLPFGRSSLSFCREVGRA